MSAPTRSYISMALTHLPKVQCGRMISTLPCDEFPPTDRRLTWPLRRRTCSCWRSLRSPTRRPSGARRGQPAWPRPGCLACCSAAVRGPHPCPGRSAGPGSTSPGGSADAAADAFGCPAGSLPYVSVNSQGRFFGTRTVLGPGPGPTEEQQDGLDDAEDIRAGLVDFLHLVDIARLHHTQGHHRVLHSEVQRLVKLTTSVENFVHTTRAKSPT